MKNIFKIVSTTFWLSALTTIKAQTNLVPNPSFEIHDSCPTSIGQINYCKYWYAPTTGTSDYYNQCYDTLIGDNYGEVPKNHMGFQNPIQNGISYAGIISYDYIGPIFNPTSREYLQSMLTTTLIANQKYYVSMYVSLSDSSVFATDDLGVYFSQTAITRNDYKAFGYTPQINNTEDNMITDNINWTKISGSFIAIGNEQYITIGNFKNDLNTDTIWVKPLIPFVSDYNSAYYFIDEVCVSTDSMHCNSIVNLKKVTPVAANFYYNIILKQLIIKQNGLYTIQITNLFGNTISNYSLHNYQTIDLSEFNNGIYIVTLTSKNGISNKKIIINP